jgi:hypothetical protein
MKRQQIHVVVESPSSPAALYRLLADARTWPAWTDMDECVPEGIAVGEVEKVGTVRANRRGRTRGWDRITELVPDERLGYEHVKGLPVVGYIASVSLTPHPNGTTITWDVSFAPRYPGTGALLRRGVEGFLTSCAQGLAGHRADD